MAAAAAEPAATSRRTCAFCCKEGADNYCGGCHAVLYCGADCQKAHWPRHGKSCARLKFPAGAPKLRFEWIRPGCNIRDAIEELTDASLPEGLNVSETPHFERVDLSQLARARGRRPVQVDCALFMQLVCGFTAGRREHLLVGLGLSASVNIHRLSWDGTDNVLRMGDEKLPVRYIHPKNEVAADHLRHSESSRGQWVAGPDKRGRYLGMSQNGPVRHSLADWEQQLLNGVEAEARSYRRPYFRIRPGLSGHDPWELDSDIRATKLSLAHILLIKDGWMLARPAPPSVL